MLARNHDFDLIILGGGSAGVVAGVVAGGAGLRTLLIEKTRMGGDSQTLGGSPSKFLLHAAQVAHQMRNADNLGLKSAPLSRLDAADVLRHIRESTTARQEAEAAADHLRKSGVELRIGDARFLSPDAVELSEREGPTRLITSDHFLLATGTAPARLENTGLNNVGAIASHEVLDLTEIPESLAVIGGSAAGLEIAQAFSRLGSRVTLIENGPRVLPNGDFEVVAALESALREEGIEILTGCAVTGAQMDGNLRTLALDGPAGTLTMTVAQVIVASGRTPRVAGLNLEAARVEFDEQNVRVNAKLHTTGPRVWACGDVIGRFQFSHLEESEAKLVVHNILYPFQQKTDPALKLAPWASHTDPEVAHVGLTEEGAQAQGVGYQVYRQSFGNPAEASGLSQPGFVKVLATGWQGKILGAQILGPRAGELIQEWISAISLGQTMRQVADTIHLSPTLSAANQNAATQWSEAQAESPLKQRTMKVYARAIRPNLPGIAAGLLGLGLLAGGALILQSMSRREQEENEKRRNR